ncbi:MAG: FkbM family methyltransferase, partial [Alphaproteobacteria bacterium]
MALSTFHGHEGEDFLALTFFGPEAGGFYVDIGAFDGCFGSATALFDTLGWRGVCTEAHPEHAVLLEKNRPSATCVHGAVVAEATGPTVTVHADPLGLATGERAPSMGRLASLYGPYGRMPEAAQKVRVPAFTLAGLMDQHAKGRRAIDLLCLDTKGTELEVLASLEPGVWDIHLLIVRAETDAKREALMPVLARLGLIRARQLEHCMMFANEAAAAMALDFRRLDCTIADAVHPGAPRTTPKHLRGRRLRDERFWMTDNVLCQQTQQPLSAILDFPPPVLDHKAVYAMPLVHGVNLFSPDGRAVDATQKTVCASMVAAAEADDGETALIHIQSAEDPDLTPGGFTRSADLARDARTLGDFAVPRPLPLLFDVLDRLAEQTPADGFMIFTNADICLKPQFYRAVRELLGNGFDALVINRRTVSPGHGFAVGSVLAEIEPGLPHPGYDCFVFRRDHYEHFVRNDALIGIPGVARGLLFNMIAQAKRMLILRNVALTYHHGDDRTWRSPDLEDYAAFNTGQNRA